MSFFASRLPGGRVPPSRMFKVAAAVTSFKRGTALVRDANGDWAECGADPTAIGAIAENDYGADTTGFSRHGRAEFPPGYMIGTLVQDEQPFKAKYVGTLPAADGGSYGIVKDSDGLWKVDFTDTTATRVKLIRRFTNAPENVALVEVVFLSANVQVN